MSRVTERNLLGALVIGLHDRLVMALNESSGLTAEGPAALVTLYWEPNITIRRLADVLDRSHPATVRIVDRLVQAGLARRKFADDLRERRVVLTARGHRTAEAVLDARLHVLEDAVSVLAKHERQTLNLLLAKVAATITARTDEAAVICRLCDERECPLDMCPITLAVTG
jgi:MarR family transcriptional regulator, negative regulator of the multidrug operon emrRAB